MLVEMTAASNVPVGEWWPALHMPDEMPHWRSGDMSSSPSPREATWTCRSTR